MGVRMSQGHIVKAGDRFVDGQNGSKCHMVGGRISQGTGMRLNLLRNEGLCDLSAPDTPQEAGNSPDYLIE